MTYLLDANVFIQAKNLHYGLDFCPAFWDWLIQNNKTKKVFSIERVEDELVGFGDQLSHWASQRGQGFFLKPDAKLIASLVTVSNWSSGQNYHPAAVNTFLQVADYYLVGYALAHAHTIVTHEVASTSRNIIKIPDVCIGLNIKHMSPYEMLRTERARFILQ